MKARLTIAACLSAALAVVGCGGSSSNSNKISGTKLTVYSSLPLQGGLRLIAKSVNQGAQMALGATGGKVGKYTVTFKPLDDSTAAKGSWDAGQTTNNAHTACDDKSTIGVI